MDETEKQAMADMYTASLDQKINDPELKLLRMGYRKQKKDIQRYFLDGYECGYAAALRESVKGDKNG